MQSERRGQSLVEALVAVAVLVSLTGVVVGLLGSCARQASTSSLAMRAQIWARQAITAMAELPFDRLLALRGDGPVAVPGLDLPRDFPGWARIEVEAPDTFPTLLLVRVRIGWNPFGKDRREGAGTFTLERLVAMPEYGLVQPLNPQA